MEDRAVKIDTKNWSDLRGLYLPETPETILGLSAISNCIRWNELKSPTDNLTIYCLNGDWSDGTFVVLDMRHLFCDSLNETSARLRTLLNLLDYSRVSRVMHVRLKHYPAISHAIRCKQLKLEFDHSNLLYYMPKENAVKLEIKLPEGFECRPLREKDVVIANANWEFAYPGSLSYLQRLARVNPSCGIFTVDGKELVSSGFQIETGPIGTLYTDPAYRQRGFGSAVVKSIFKQIAANGYGVTACVKEANLTSRAIFEKIGCQIIGEVHWISMECDWIDETRTE